MPTLNPLSQRDFSAGLQPFRKGFGHQCRGSMPQTAPAAPTLSTETVQSSLAIAYEKMQTVLQSRLQTVGAPAATPAAENSEQDYSPQSVADRIVGFISDRLTQEKANGASDEELQALYQQALQGVEKGLRDGKDIIKAQGSFAGEVKDTFYETVNLIADGLEELGESLFGEIPDAETPDAETPTTPAPTTGSGFEASLTQMAMERSRSFEMEVTTQEGDKVKILVNSGQSFSGQQVNYADGSTSIDGFEASFSSFDNLSFSVEGDLNEEELAALNDLFGQVNDVAETFYGGNIEQAFDQAMTVGMDPEQLASFAVNMNQTETVAVRNTYVSVQNMAGPVRSNPYEDLFQRLGDFAKQVKQSAEAVDSIASSLDNIKSLYADLLGRLHPGRGNDEGRRADRGNDFQRFMNRLAS